MKSLLLLLFLPRPLKDNLRKRSHKRLDQRWRQLLEEETGQAQLLDGHNHDPETWKN